ncbi:MAG: aminotransferase class IV [Candidatus Omnitrophica bacterium]|nr:aminotransferase class IV [Candidatus Omnitrophota bacterium]
MASRLLDPPRWTLPSPESASGCFETMRAYQGKIFRLPAHLGRLFASAKYLGFRMPLESHQLGRRLIERLRASGLEEAVVRVACLPDANRAAVPSIVVQPAQRPSPAMYRRGIRITVVPTRKFPVSQIDPRSKFSSRLGSVMAVVEAQLRGADEAVFLDGTGSVTESTASNLGLVKHGCLVAPPGWMGLLAGITWQAVTDVARALRMPVREVPLTRHDVYNADEAFLASTLKEVLAVTQVDGRRIGTGKPGPYTKRLHRGFQELVHREIRNTRYEIRDDCCETGVTELLR